MRLPPADRARLPGGLHRRIRLIARSLGKDRSSMASMERFGQSRGAGRTSFGLPAGGAHGVLSDLGRIFFELTGALEQGPV
jgi:hypothetical protein